MQRPQFETSEAAPQRAPEAAPQRASEPAPQRALEAAPQRAVDLALRAMHLAMAVLFLSAFVLLFP